MVLDSGRAQLPGRGSGLCATRQRHQPLWHETVDGFRRCSWVDRAGHAILLPALWLCTGCHYRSEISISGKHNVIRNPP